MFQKIFFTISIIALHIVKSLMQR